GVGRHGALQRRRAARWSGAAAQGRPARAPRRVAGAGRRHQLAAHDGRACARGRRHRIGDRRGPDRRGARDGAGASRLERSAAGARDRLRRRGGRVAAMARLDLVDKGEAADPSWGWWLLVLVGVVSVAAGVILVLKPSHSLATLSVVFGIFLLI